MVLSSFFRIAPIKPGQIPRVAQANDREAHSPATAAVHTPQSALTASSYQSIK